MYVHMHISQKQIFGLTVLTHLFIAKKLYCLGVNVSLKTACILSSLSRINRA